MDDKHLTNPEYVQQIIDLINTDISKSELEKIISNFHYSDIADALEKIEPEKRNKIYEVVSDEEMAEILAYVEDCDVLFKEMDTQTAADILSEMDSDDAVDILEELDDEVEDKIIELMDDESAEDIELIQSYDEEEIGSRMTTNYIEINQHMTIKEAMRSLTAQAQENDNISTIYVSDDAGKFYGAIDLKDLITTKEGTPLEKIITNSYPTVYDHELISDLLEDLKDYAEDSFPVLNKEDHIIGIITSQDIIEVVDEEMSDDYAKLGGLSSEEDLNESTFASVKKRIPWLIVLLFLGMGVSSVVGIFENVVAIIPIVICFQSLILDMSGNVGTQSLAVTIRVLMDENIETKEKLRLILKEVKVGFTNGCCLGLLAIGFITLYVHFFKGQLWFFSLMVAVCVAIALIVAMVISSFVGTIVPIIFNKLNIDPAVASGPLITTINDLVAVVCYYGMAWVLLIEIFQLV